MDLNLKNFQVFSKSMSTAVAVHLNDFGETPLDDRA